MTIKELNKNVSIFMSNKLGLLVWLEQKILISKKFKLCADCGNKGDIPQKSGLIKSVDYYYFCKRCANYWNKKKNLS